MPTRSIFFRYSQSRRKFHRLLLDLRLVRCSVLEGRVCELSASCTAAACGCLQRSHVLCQQSATPRLGGAAGVEIGRNWSTQMREKITPTERLQFTC